jgi:hypothetical protein
MKILASLGIAALSLVSLHAADPQPPAATPDARNPAPQPEADGRRWGHGEHGKMMHGGGREAMMRREGMCRGPKETGGKELSEKGRPMEHPLANALQLTDAQKAKAKELMEAAKPRIEAIREEERAKIKAVIEEALAQLRPLLTPEQQAVFDDLQKLKTDKAALKPATPAAKPGAPAKSE